MMITTGFKNSIGMGGGGIKESSGGYNYKCDIFDTY
jgi:hypothetical protein